MTDRLTGRGMDPAQTTDTAAVDVGELGHVYDERPTRLDDLRGRILELLDGGRVQLAPEQDRAVRRDLHV